AHSEGHMVAKQRKHNRWSASVTRNSNALVLQKKVFASKTPGAIARSLKCSAEQSSRRKTTPYRSAMSMLTFYITRAGKNLPKSRLRVFGTGQGGTSQGVRALVTIMVSRHDR